MQPSKLREAGISQRQLNSLFLHPFRQGLCCYYYGKLREKYQNNKTQKTQVSFRELRVAMFVATPAFCNKGAIYRNGEISDFHNTSCSGTGPLFPPHNVPQHFCSSSCTNATTSGSADHATNNPHKPLDIYILFKCRISW